MWKKYEVSLAEGRMEIIDYLTEQLGFSSRQSKKLLKDRRVHINGKAAYRDSMLKNGDVLEVNMSEESRADIIPENIKLDVIYEDQDILVVNKPPFMLVHPTPNHPGGTLLNAAAYYLSAKGERVVLRLLNRLDMNTSGIVVLPKSAAVHSKLDEMMKSGKVKKYYLAVIEGSIQPEKGIIDKPIGKDIKDPIKRMVSSDGQSAITIYETLRKSANHSLVRLELVTGRTHQIRVHLSHLGHPIIGDTLYGKESPLIKRQALHASELEFPYPAESDLLSLHAELPGDICTLVSALGLE